MHAAHPLSGMLDSEPDISVRELITETPGSMIYEDELQFAAKPSFRDAKIVDKA